MMVRPRKHDGTLLRCLRIASSHLPENQGFGISKCPQLSWIDFPTPDYLHNEWVSVIPLPLIRFKACSLKQSSSIKVGRRVGSIYLVTHGSLNIVTEAQDKMAREKPYSIRPVKQTKPKKPVTKGRAPGRFAKNLQVASPFPARSAKGASA